MPRILDTFASYRWIGAKPAMLDYDNTQFLLIGSSDEDLSHATEPQPPGQDAGQADPKDELEKLEEEDTKRVESLKREFWRTHISRDP
jgi:hypothetical protein